MSTNWTKIRTEYITTDTSYRKLSEKYGVPLRTIAHIAKEEEWVKQREQHCNNIATEILNSDTKKTVDRYTRLMTATDRLLDKVEQAIDELDMHIAKTTYKTKTIEYKNHDCPNKATKEIIEEKEEVLAYQSIVDKLGLKQVASALKDIKEVQMIKNELDRQEQEARIAKLKRDSGEYEDNGEQLGVFVLPAIQTLTPPDEDGESNE